LLYAAAVCHSCRSYKLTSESERERPKRDGCVRRRFESRSPVNVSSQCTHSDSGVNASADSFPQSIRACTDPDSRYGPALLYDETALVCVDRVSISIQSGGHVTLRQAEGRLPLSSSACSRLDLSAGEYFAIDCPGV
jgi:hypothetical protein